MAMNPHHQRAMDLLTQSVPVLANNANINVNANSDGYSPRDEENGGLRSAWSPDRGEEESYIPWGVPPSENSVKSRLRRLSTIMHYKPEFWPKAHQRRRVGLAKSLKAVVLSSYLNVLLPVLPILWTLHFLHKIDHVVTFGLCFVSLIPLIKLLDFGAENIALYCGKDLGDLIVITINNAVEAILALFLLVKWELRLLQSTIIGVVTLRLLLVPGTAFITGGARIATQELHPHLTELNHSLLTMGALTFLLPVSFFTALDRGAFTQDILGVESVLNDSLRDQLLKVSRGIAIILLVVYVCSRLFLHRPPGEEEKGLHKRKDAPEELKRIAEELEDKEVETSLSVALLLLLISGGMMAVTAEILVESINPMRRRFDLPEEWFGLILLPIVSFSPDALISLVNFIRSTFFRQKVTTPQTLAEYRSIELAIQFMLLWTPFIVLLGWIIQRPMTLLFDLFEVAVLFGSCFLLNYVTADAKTNWAEGVMLVALYFMIALTAWFYPGQPEINVMLSSTSIAEALQSSNLTATNSSLTFSPTPTSTSTSTSVPQATPSIVTVQTSPTAVVTPLSNEVLTDKLQALLLLYDILLEEKLIKENHTIRPKMKGHH